MNKMKWARKGLLILLVLTIKEQQYQLHYRQK